MIRIVAAIEVVIRDIEVARTGIVSEDTNVDVLESTVLHRKALRPRDKLRAGPDADIRIPDGDPLEVVVIGGLDIEQVKVAVAVKYDVTIARRLDRDRFFRRAAGREV